MDPHGFLAAGYRVRDTLFEGAERALHRATRVADEAPVVLERWPSGSADGARRAGRALDVAAKLAGTAAVRALGVFEASEGAALVVADEGALPLACIERVARGPLGAGEFVELAVEITRAVASVHAKNFVHKALDLESIWLGPDGRARLAGLEYAAHLPLGTRVVFAGALEGHPAFVSPEQTGRMNRGFDFRSDLYSLGVVFYRLLTGRLPFEAADAAGWVHCHIARVPEPASSARPGVPRALSDLVARLLAKAAEERYQSAVGLLTDLEKARAAIEATGSVEPFELATDDVPDRLQFPQRLYGREREIAALLEAFAEVTTGGPPGAMLVGGYSGVGKSALVHELERPVTEIGGRFVRGKFDQFKRDIPLATIVAAFKSLVRSLLTEPEHALARWRRAVQEALGNTGALVTAVIPELEWIVGPQPALPALGPAESQNRFVLTFLAFVRVFARREHPLVLFFDDMQWADLGTLDFIERMLLVPDLEHVWLVLAYRDNEVDAAHPLSAAIARARRDGARVRELHLAPLRLAHVRELCADLVRAPAARVAPLAEVAFEKTQGSPFYLHEFLKSLYQDGLLAFDAGPCADDARPGWRWDAAEIRRRTLSDSVVDLLLARIARLSPATRSAVRLAACIGGAFTRSALARVSGRSRDEVANDLLEALEVGLVLADDDERYRFHHDRIQQAAYSLVPEVGRKALHLEIARLLSAGLTAADAEPVLFDVANHFNTALELVTDPAERRRAYDFDLLAGRRAKASAAYAPALTYFRAARELLAGPGVDAFEAHYDDALFLHLELAECSYLAGDLEAGARGFETVIAHARSDLDRAKAYYLKLELLQVAGRYHEAAALSLEAFGLFGLRVADDEAAVGALLQAEIALVEGKFKELSVDDVFALPRMTDPTAKALVDLLEASAPPLYMAKPYLFPYACVKMVSLSLEHGNTETSCYGYGVYGLMLCAAFGDVPRGHALTAMAIRLNEAFGDAKIKGSLLHLWGDHVNFWVNPIADDFDALERGFAACVEAGDLVYSNYIGFQGTWQVFERGGTLDELLKHSARFLEFSRRTKHEANALTIRYEQQFARALQGRTLGPTSFDEAAPAAFSDERAFAAIAAAGFTCGEVYRHVMKLALAVTFRAWPEALAAAELAERVLSAALSMPIQTSYWLYRAIALAAARGADAAAEVDDARAKFAAWAEHAPANFAAKGMLLGAELAALRGAEPAAVRAAYDDAIARARLDGLVHVEALACECAARWLERSADGHAGAYLADARRAYERWGAAAKATALEPPRARPAAGGGAATELDLAAIVKASQTISETLVLGDLLERLMSVVLEHAGATGGAIVRRDDDGVDWIEVRARVARGALRVDRARASLELDGGHTLAPSAVNLARRTGEAVLVGDAPSTPPFSSDPYVARTGVRSILCMPVRSKGHTTAVLYLENHVARDAFSEGKRAVLEMLVAQVAISLDNATLYARLQEENAERRRGEAQLRLVTDALPALVGYFDRDERYRFTNSAYREWFGIEPESMHGKSIEEALGPKAYALAKAHVARALAGERAEVEHVIEYPTGARDVIATYVPDLDAGGAVRGAVVLVHDVSSLRKSEREKAELRNKERAALEASRMKSAFLANMSHEIRTPINGVIGMLTLLGDTALTPDQREFTETAKASAGGLLGIVNDILDFSKVEAGKLEITATELDLTSLVSSVARAHGLLARDKGLELDVSLPMNLTSMVWGDASRISQVLNNLLSNAVKFTASGRVELRVRVAAESDERVDVVFEVRDTGIGISRDAATRLFTPFTQAESDTTRRFGGTGLGLSISKQLVDLMGGRIGFASEPGEGTTFRVELALRRGRALVAAPAADPSRPRFETAAPFEGRVLVVEDNAVNQRVAVLLLAKMGVKADAVPGGREALEALVKTRYALVFMDCQMPDLDGYQTTELVRASPDQAIRAIPIVAMTANAIQGDREKCLAAGMNDYLSKPIQRDALESTVRKWLG